RPDPRVTAARRKCQPELEAVSGGEASMGVAGAFICGTGRIAGEHGSRFPASETHQVALGAAAGEPVVRERVPKLVRVKIGQTDSAAPFLDHLVDAACRQSALLAKPEPGVGCARVCGSHADVPVNVAGGLGPDR